MRSDKNISYFIVKFGYYGFVTAVVAGVLFSLKLLFVPLLASLLLTMVLEPLVNYFETRGLRRMTVIAGMSGLLVLLIAGGGYLVIPRIITEAQNLAANIPEYDRMLRESLGSLTAALQERFPSLDIPDLYRLAQQRMPGGGGMDIDAVIAHASSFASVLSVVVIIPIATFFLLADGHLIRKALLRMAPNKYFEMFVLLFHKITSSLKLFLRGQLIDALAVGVMTAAGLLIIGLPYAVVIGIIAGLGNLIPYLGPIIGFIPALLVILMSPEGLSIMPVVSVAAVFAIVQFLEGTFVYPIAVGKSVDLHPLAVIIGITVGGQLGGILGMLIAVPLISIAKVSLEVLHSNLKSYSII
jgi:predicted PurR-regulated permease PerM